MNTPTNRQVPASQVKPGDKFRSLGPGMMFRVVESVDPDGTIHTASLTAYGPADRLVWIADPEARF
jgi:hypothetical protein